MMDLKRRMLDIVSRVLGFLRANPDLIEKTEVTNTPSVRITQTRKTLTNTKTTKQTKGEQL